MRLDAPSAVYVARARARPIGGGTRWLGLVPLLGWYLAALMSWRVALLPYRDWEPRGRRAVACAMAHRELVGFWRSG